jgi:hypothetical protein
MDAGGLAFAGLQSVQPFPPVADAVHQFVQFRIGPGPDHAAFPHRKRGLFGQAADQIPAPCLHGHQLAALADENRSLQGIQAAAHRAGLDHGETQALQIAGMAAGRSATRDDAFHVVDGLQVGAQLFQDFGLGEQFLYRVVPLADGGGVEQGMGEPELEGASAHRRHRAIQKMEQGPMLIVAMHRADQFQVADGGRVQGHMAVETGRGEADQMIQLGLLVLLHVGESGGGGPEAELHMAAIEGLEGMHLELPRQRRDPLLEVEESLGQGGDQDMVLFAQAGQVGGEIGRFGKEHFLGAQAVHLVHDLLEIAFHDHEPPCAQVQVG